MTAFVGLGSNLGDRAGNLLLAVRGLMDANLEIFRLSAIYETEPVGVAAGHAPYLNMVAEARASGVTPEQMLARMIRLEYLLGRREKNLKTPRTVDLDLLFFGALKYRTEFLTLPHPRLHLRRFVLVPLAEIAPHVVHPLLNRSVQDLLNDCADTAEVKRWNPGS